MLKFNDGENWTSRIINGVIKAYYIPNDIGDSNVAVDVGANIGAFSLVNHTKFNKIIAIEAANETYLRCVEIIKHIPNANVYNLAAGKNDDEIVKIRHYKDGSKSGNATTLDDPKWYRNGEYEEIKTILLEGIYKKFDIKKNNYLKVDCEGAEYHFLMNKYISNIDYIGIEVHIHLGEKAKEVMDYIENTHKIISKFGDGNSMHYEITYKNKNI